MVFWRSRSEKKAEAPAIAVEAEPANDTAATDSPDSSKSEKEPAQTNVVTLVTGRLADRLADVAVVSGSGVSVEIKTSKVAKLDTGAEPSQFIGQDRSVTKIRAALANKTFDPLVIFGEPGLGRKEIARALAPKAKRAAADDWIYVIEHTAPSRAKAIAIPAGEGERFVRETRTALAKASAAFERYVRSDDFRINRDLLDEETRFQCESAVEGIRRRAEMQNIAVVKSLDGYVLAPMHEGRVVRSDVFRALPDTLKRNVEAKITVLEDELQSVVATLPDTELEAHEKYEALVRHTAVRAVRPSLAPVKASFSGNAAAVAALESIETAFVAAVARGTPAEQMLDVLLDIGAGGAEISDDRVVVATGVSPTELLGEIGRDARGRVVLVPGYLARAASGTVIIEAWKLAADPKAWVALSSVLSTRVFAPLTAPGLALKADPVPLSATVVLIADAQSWSKLEAIEPGFARYFPNVAKLAESAPLADLGEEKFGELVAQIVSENDLKAVNSAAVPALHKDAVRRGSGRVSLSRSALAQVLRSAHTHARSHSDIRVSDIEAALALRADGHAP